MALSVNSSCGPLPNRHTRGEGIARLRPEDSRVIGTFEFEEGMDGFAEIRAAGSQRLVLADAVAFRPD